MNQTIPESIESARRTHPLTEGLQILAAVVKKTSSLLALLLAAKFSLVAALAAGDPFADAAGVWWLGDTNGGLAVEGKVQLGVVLPDHEREASRRRGGNGRAARFDGGWLQVGLKSGPPLSLKGKAMTLYARVQVPSGEWAAPLFAKDDPNDTYGTILYGDQGQLQYAWRTEPLAQQTGGFTQSRPLRV